MMQPGYIITPYSISLVINNIPTVIDNSHPNYDKIREALKARDYTQAVELANIVKTLQSYVTDNIEINGGVLYYKGTALHTVLVERILQMRDEGFDITPMVLFLENLMKNPSSTAVNELYQWLESSNLPITDDGYFIAYKKVDDNFLDFYTGTFTHNIGDTPSMPRNMVDDNRTHTCSQGLHFCAFDYLSHYHSGRGKVVILKINPSDVVSIPNDYNFQKGRACTYQVIGIHEAGESKPLEAAAVYNPASDKADVSSYTILDEDDSSRDPWG